MECHYEHGETEGALTLSGSVTIDHASEIKVALLEALSSNDIVMVDLSKADSIDLACIQLLCSAHHTAGSMGKAFSIGGNKSEGVVRSVGAAGYLRHVGCRYDVTKTCLWVERKWKESIQ